MYSVTNIYLKNQIQTNSPEKLVLMLYNGLKRFTKQGLNALEARDMEGVNANFIRSQDILLELMSGVNLETGEIAQNLYQLYEYMHHQLVQANLKKKREPALEVLKMASELADAWNLMLKEKDKSKAPSREHKAVAIGR